MAHEQDQCNGRTGERGAKARPVGRPSERPVLVSVVTGAGEPPALSCWGVYMYNTAPASSATQRSPLASNTSAAGRVLSPMLLVTVGVGAPTVLICAVV